MLDVGHGNCTLIEGYDKSAVVDAPQRQSLLQFLLDKSMTSIDYLLVSHADSDHISGVVALLLDDRWKIGSIYINPDPIRRTRTWDWFKTALYQAQLSGTQVHSCLTTTDPRRLPLGSVTIEVLAPSAVLAISGPDSRLLETPLSANTVSAVIRVTESGKGRVLLAADLDDVGLDHLATELVRTGGDAEARVLVFPHHGGRPGGADPATFTRRLCTLVRPKEVVFSNGRGLHGTPRPEIVSAIRSVIPDVRIACTQLSTHCSPRRAGESRGGSACAGTITISLSTGTWESPSASAHEAFIASSVEHPLCWQSDAAAGPA